MPILKTMKNTFLLLLTVFISANASAQEENANYCSKRTRHTNQSMKSNSLSVAQISETERYNVHYYALDLAMTNLSTNVSGTVEIHATAKENLDSALFELFSSFTINAIAVNGNQVNYSRNSSAIKVPVNALTGANFIISINYAGTPPTAATNPLGGSGVTNTSSPTWGNQVTFTLSQPFSAYEWWPCKQSLGDKADSCSVKITVPSNCKAGSNGVLENVVDLGNGSTRYEWKHRHPIDYYLISVSVAKYIDYSIYANPAGAPAPILIQNFIYDNPQTLPNFQAEIDETASFIELFSELFGPYPFADEKYGHCMAPLSGGMEHQTMTTQGWFEKSLTAHELGHQWFGNNVTCASWADIWVNEGFASYADYLMIENNYPAEKVQYMLDVHANVKSQPGGSVYCIDSLNEARIFSGRLSYDKGSAIVHTMRFMVNNDNLFFEALRNYQNAFKDSVAKGMDVKNTVEATTGVDLTAFMNEWYFGEGFPTYSTRWNSVNNQLILEISQTTSKPSVTPLFTNPLEVRFSRSGQADTTIRFSITGNTTQFIVPNVGVVTNVTGIDPSNWIINSSGSNVYDPLFLSIDETKSSHNWIKIYPNPTNDIIQFEFPEGIESMDIKVIDANGKKVMDKRLKKGEFLSVQKLPQGNYTIDFMLDENHNYSSAFIKID